MKVVRDTPPMFLEIAQAFSPLPPGVLISFGDTLFNPDGAGIRPDVMAHEEEHGRRQLAYPGGEKAWWRMYIDDPQFRCEEEVAAFGAQHDFISNSGVSRQVRRAALRKLAQDLCRPMYGFGLSRDDAYDLIRYAAKR